MKMTRHNLWVRLLSAGVIIYSVIWTKDVVGAENTQSVVSMNSSREVGTPSYIYGQHSGESENANTQDRPFSDAGHWLQDNGITPHLSVSQFWLGNPGLGIKPNQNQNYTLFYAGADVNLDKMGVIPGATIHFLQMWVPFSSNLELGNQAADFLGGNPPPYLPKVPHLQVLTWEQNLLDDRLMFEIGKRNPGSVFGLSQCNIPLSCVNPILDKSAIFGPSPYTSWGARVQYKFTPALSAQIGAWRTYTAFPFTNGWERSWRNGDWRGETSVFMANVAKRVNWQQETYPFNWEIMAFRNNKHYDDEYYTVDGTSKVYNPDVAVKTHSGVSGYYMTMRKAFWRRDGGRDTTNPSPTALSVHGSWTQVLGSDAYRGMSSLATAGLTWSAPWQSRPHDSYGLTLHWARMTDSEQRYLQDAFDNAGGSGWSVPRNEYSLSLDAAIELTPEVSLIMTGQRIWKTNTWMTPVTSVRPQDGYQFWISLDIYLDKLLGLDPASH